MSKFRVIEHTCPGQHIREYPRATSTHQEEELRLAVKQYVPLDNSTPQPGDVTILASHSNGFTKELYEPLWDDLHEISKHQGFRIRSVWMADVAHQGGSYCLNEDKLGDDPHFHDNARDLLQIVNTFRNEFPRPVMGIGHSMGCDALLWLSTMHPRLLSSLVLVDPTIGQQPAPNVNAIVKLATNKKDILPSMSAAHETMSKSPLLQKFDPRVKERMRAVMFRPLPTFLYPDGTAEHAGSSREASCGDNPVAFRTPKHQEAFSLVRPNYDGHTSNAPSEGFTPSAEMLDTHPDVHHSFSNDTFYFPASMYWRNHEWLKSVRPPTLFIWGDKSPYAREGERTVKMHLTGTGPGGSGGARLGRVQQRLVDGASHFVCFEQVEKTAHLVGEWFSREMARWPERERRIVEGNGNSWPTKDRRKKQMMDDRWVQHVRKWDQARGTTNILKPQSCDREGKKDNVSEDGASQTKTASKL